jgi:hypothetical protein
VAGRPRRRGEARQHEDRPERHARQDRHDDEHPDRDERPRPPAQRRRLAPARDELAQRRADVREEVGDAGEVGEDVVAVGPDHRRQLLDHLDHLQADEQQQRVDAGEQPDAHREHGDQAVEVQPAEVGAQAVAAREPVGVGDVGVEGGPHEVQPDAHAAGRAAAVAAGRRVAELVEAGREHGQRGDEQQQAGPVEGLRRR